MPLDPAIKASVALNLFPISIQQAILSDHHFCDSIQLQTDATIVVSNEIDFSRHELFEAIRHVFSGAKEITVADQQGATWQVTLTSADTLQQVVISTEARTVPLPLHLGALSPERKHRLETVSFLAQEHGLSGSDTNQWLNLAAQREFGDSELNSFIEVLKETPSSAFNELIKRLAAGSVGFHALVPRTTTYYNRLIGDWNGEASLNEFLLKSEDHQRNLTSRDPVNGLYFALLASWQSLLVPTKIASDLPEQAIEEVIATVTKSGDLISQLAALELVLPQLQERPDLVASVRVLLEQLTAGGEVLEARFRLLSALVTLVGGELARLGHLRDHPPFWRRLATFTQASLVPRQHLWPDLRL